MLDLFMAFLPTILRIVLRASELASLCFTVPTIVLSLMVVHLFFSEAWKSVRTRIKRKSIEWFALGIVIGFAGSVLDNLFWSIPWTCHYLGLTITSSLIEVGPVFNIPFRQIAGTAAAYCHVRSAYEQFSASRQQVRWLNYVLVASLMVGIAMSIGLVVLDHVLDESVLSFLR